MKSKLLQNPLKLNSVNHWYGDLIYLQRSIARHCVRNWSPTYEKINSYKLVLK